ncbi:MAG: hypothetical protein ACXWCG_00210 [Flavitalea sp.]
MSIWIDGFEIVRNGKLLKYANVAPECYGSINDPKILIKKIKDSSRGFDIVTFGQRLPDITPQFNYYLEWEEIAALRITTYENWLNKQIIKENRKNIIKAAKKGITVCESEFNDDFVKGIVDIYNESPIRQGKKFPHYKKDFETVKYENGSYLDRSIFIGAYYENNLIGFVKIVLTEQCASTMQVISMIEHRDKKPTNALLAKTVEVCATRSIPFLQYGVWSRGSIGKFKIYNGFEKMLVPKYIVPITLKGKVVLGINLHREVKYFIPNKIIDILKDARKKWYEF